MSVAEKRKSREIDDFLNEHVFGDLVRTFTSQGPLFPNPSSTRVKNSVRLWLDQAPLEDALALKNIVRDVFSEVESHLPSPSLDDLSTRVTPEEIEQARLEDTAGKRARKESERRRASPLSTPESVKRGQELIAEGLQRGTELTATRIASGELITSAQLQDALKVGRSAISDAVKSKRMFAVLGPAGQQYYPAFFADEFLDRRVVESVSKALGSLPASSKFYFFTSGSERLGETPLDALRKGREKEVLEVAKVFVNR